MHLAPHSSVDSSESTVVSDAPDVVFDENSTSVQRTAWWVYLLLVLVTLGFCCLVGVCIFIWRRTHRDDEPIERPDLSYFCAETAAIETPAGVVSQYAHPPTLETIDAVSALETAELRRRSSPFTIAAQHAQPPTLETIGAVSALETAELRRRSSLFNATDCASMPDKVLYDHSFAVAAGYVSTPDDGYGSMGVASTAALPTISF